MQQPEVSEDLSLRRYEPRMVSSAQVDYAVERMVMYKYTFTEVNLNIDAKNICEESA